MVDVTEYICAACGTQYPGGPVEPAQCPICQDARQFVPVSGQAWVTPADLSARLEIVWNHEEPAVQSLILEPHFAIGQRAFLIETDQGNILWDCIGLVDDNAIASVRSRGGLFAIAISHPHYYSTMGAWSSAFGDVPIYLHEGDRRWVQNRSPAIRFWDGDTLELTSELTLVHCGGHFAGGAVLHWSNGADRSGCLFSGDIIQVTPGGTHVSFMYSYPNMIPLNNSAVSRIVDSIRPFEFDRVYGAFAGRTIPSGGKTAVIQSAERYLRAISTGLGG